MTNALLRRQYSKVLSSCARRESPLLRTAQPDYALETPHERELAALLIFSHTGIVSVCVSACNTTKGKSNAKPFPPLLEGDFRPHLAKTGGLGHARVPSLNAHQYNRGIT
jgi:hypothetical protein